VSWEVTLHPLVFEEDFKKIDPSSQQKIIKAIRKKLTTNPKEYGDPLRGLYREYWKLRVGEYRVVYRIEENQVKVKVIKVGIRRNFEVYNELAKRITKIS